MEEEGSCLSGKGDILSYLSLRKVDLTLNLQKSHEP